MSRVSIKTKRLAFCSVISALGVVQLLLGSIIDVLELSAAMLASILCVLAVVEAGGVWPWLCYSVTSVLSLLLLPNKMPALIYVFAGFYPMVKQVFERLPRVVSWLLKLLVFNASMGVVIVICRVFMPEVDFSLIPGVGGVWMYVVLFAVGNFTFLLYDIAVTKLVTLYIFKLRDRLKLKLK